MSRVRLYVDEDAMDGALISVLRLNGIDVQSALEVGLLETPDEVHLDFASRAGRTLYTFNQADFPRIHRDWLAARRPHAGIVVGSQQRHSIGEQLRRLNRIVSGMTAEQMVDRIEFLGSWALRCGKGRGCSPRSLQRALAFPQQCRPIDNHLRRQQARIPRRADEETLTIGTPSLLDSTWIGTELWRSRKLTAGRPSIDLNFSSVRPSALWPGKRATGDMAE